VVAQITDKDEMVVQENHSDGLVTHKLNEIDPQCCMACGASDVQAIARSVSHTCL
jgi:hypothetical protein